MSVQNSLVMHPIEAYGSEAQKQQYLPQAGDAARCVGCFGLTEPDAGSDPGCMKTQGGAGQRRLPAQRLQDVDHQFADRRCGGGLGEVEDEGIRGFIVERGMKGFSTPKIEGKMSLSAPR